MTYYAEVYQHQQVYAGYSPFFCFLSRLTLAMLNPCLDCLSKARLLGLRLSYSRHVWVVHHDWAEITQMLPPTFPLG